jgi:hypothetical protein
MPPSYYRHLQANSQLFLPPSSTLIFFLLPVHVPVVRKTARLLQIIFHIDTPVQVQVPVPEGDCAVGGYVQASSRMCACDDQVFSTQIAIPSRPGFGPYGSDVQEGSRPLAAYFSASQDYTNLTYLSFFFSTACSAPLGAGA